MVRWVSPEPDLKGRRGFLAWMLGVLGGGFAGLFGYTTLIYTRPPRIPGQRTHIQVPRTNLHEGANQFRLRGETIYLVMREGEINVFSAKCTHLGCLVIWDENSDGFLCPCHGALFGPDGTAIRGPTNVPLREIPFSEASGVITIGEVT